MPRTLPIRKRPAVWLALLTALAAVVPFAALWVAVPADGAWPGEGRAAALAVLAAMLAAAFAGVRVLTRRLVGQPAQRLGDATPGDDRARCRRLTDNLTDHFLYARGPDGLFRDASPSVRWVLGHDPAAFRNDDPMPLTDNPLNGAARAFTQAALRGEQPPAYEVEVYHRDGHPRTLVLQEAPVFDDAGNVAAVEGIAHDITERKGMEETLRHALRELERANRDLEQFAYTASHNMGEPLRMVTTQLQLLERRYRDTLPDAGRDALDMATDGAGRLRALVQALLAYSRIAVEGQPFDTVDLDTLFRRVLEGLRDAIAGAGATVTADRPLPAALGDREQLFQLLHHLVANGVRYRHPERPVHLHVAVDRPPEEEGWLRLSVRDNGQGIDPDDLERVFRIYRRPDLHGSEAEGAGIGLAAARRIVERHGGRIWLDSDGVSGTTVVFTLPVPD